MNPLSEPRIVEAIEANLFGFLSLFQHWSAAELHDDPDLLCSLTEIPFPFFNSVLRARIRDDQVNQRIESLLTRSRIKQVPLLWWIGPSSEPPGLGQVLENHGFTHDGDYPGMAADLEELPAPSLIPGLSIERVTHRDALQQWANACVDGFGMPSYVGDAFFDLFTQLGLEDFRPLRHYLGLLDGVPVATASLLIHSGVAGIYNVSVIPTARRLGIGAQLTLQPLHDAHQAGIERAILHASEMATNVYQRLGFQSYCTISHFVGDASLIKAD